MAKRKKFKVKQQTREIDLTGTLEGGWAKLNLNMPMRLMLNIENLDELSKQEQRDTIVEFGDSVLVEWNLVGTDGNDIPPNGEGLLSLGSADYLSFFRSWAVKVNGGENLEQQSSEPDTSV